MKPEKILLLCAHPDDQIIGPGATIAKYAKEKKIVYAMIFSLGEMYPFWIKTHLTKQRRRRESEDAGKIVGIKKTIYFGIQENVFEKEIAEKKIGQKVLEFIKRHEIKQVFAHNIDDPHPHHKFLAKFTIDLLKDSDVEIYSFNIWNPFNFKHSNAPKVYIDVTKTFRKKLKALRKFKSQRIVLWQFIPVVLFRGFMDGLSNGTRFAESFIKVK